MSKIIPILMPKWGLTMEEGTIGAWLVNIGDQVTVGMPIAEIDTDKITNTYEAGDAGVVRRILQPAGATLPIRALIGIMTEGEVSEAQIDEYIRNFTPPAVD
ncbi:biotin/lipoyl-containing protein [Psittacicella hinzii]|uniref:Lipoyl-binding domain-containing protein n=1 Tax=Psittacicella hinzii TaxID=2028575 RepID=A0A3A1YVE4_9GAMM|nr:biotin/lipoyl-containing protein [Psittacicella hinzii]RIY40810.1 hypothetical protein CKF58_00075 [Psittacicella hinzii]